MKNHILPIAISLAFTSLASAADQTIPELKTVYQGKLPWQGGYSVQLLLPKEWNDPGDFTQLKILKGKKSMFSINELQAEKIKNVESFPPGTQDLGEHLKMVPLDRSGKTMALALNDWMGGSSDNQLILLGLDKKSAVYPMFRKSVHLAKIDDFDGDGKFDLLQKGGRGESDGKSFAYDPYLVLKQTTKAGRIAFEVDDELSKKWSAENKFEWHGAKYDDKLRLDENGKAVPSSSQQ